MKQSIALVLTALMVLTLAACGGASPQPPASPAPESPAAPSSQPESAPVSSSEPSAASSQAPEAGSSAAAPSSSAAAPSSSAAAPSSSAAPASSSAPSSSAPTSSASAPEPSSSVPASSETSSASPATAGNKDLGEIAMVPANGATVGIGIDRLLVLVPRVGVECGDVELTVYNASDNSEFVTVDLSDAVDYLEWADENTKFSEKEGTALQINLGQPLEGGHSYYILAEEGWLAMPEEGILSKPLANKNDWAIHAADLGIDYDSDAYSDVAVGQSVTFSCTVGEAAKAKLTVSPKDAAELSEKELSQDGEVTVTFQKKGAIALTVSFYDEKGKEIESIVQKVTCK